MKGSLLELGGKHLTIVFVEACSGQRSQCGLESDLLFSF